MQSHFYPSNLSQSFLFNYCYAVSYILTVDVTVSSERMVPINQIAWHHNQKTVMFVQPQEYEPFEAKYEGESILIRNAVAFVFLLAALSFSCASLCVVFFLSQLCRFEVARSVPLSQP